MSTPYSCLCTSYPEHVCILHCSSFCTERCSAHGCNLGHCRLCLQMLRGLAATSSPWQAWSNVSSVRWASASALGCFSSIVGASQVVTDAHTLERYNTDWTGQVKGASQVLLLPQTTEQVSSLLAYCHQERYAAPRLLPLCRLRAFAWLPHPFETLRLRRTRSLVVT